MQKRHAEYLSEEKGVALVLTLLFVLVLTILGSVFVLRTVNEKNISERERLLSQAFYASEGGGEAGLAKLDELINTDLFNTVNDTNPNVLSTKAEQFVATSNALGFLVDYVKKGGAAQLTLSGSQAVYSQGATALGSGTYSYDVVITQKGTPVTITADMWDFSYFYQINATGVVSGISRKIVLAGDFIVRVQRDNFAKFALFTDHHSMPSGSTVWFTNKTNFAGPLHTNERYSFAFNPSGTFQGTVTQHHTTARFYNNGFPFLADASANGTIDVPVFNSTYTRGEDEIVLASSVQKQDLSDQATGNQVFTGSGIFVANNGTALTGGIFVRGNPTIAMSVDGSNNAVYTITQGTTIKTITVDQTNNQTTIVTSGGGGTVSYQGQPDGVDDLGTIIYVDGTVSGLEGTVQKDTEVTISSEFDMVISDHIRYSDYNPAVGTPGAAGYIPPNADDKKNLLGLVSWGGNVRVGTTAPDDLEMHGIFMARNGIFTVDSYDDQTVGPRGTATLLGGVITQFYGAFGLFSGSTGAQLSGYGRNFVYDSRTLLGKSPPYFPSMNTFIAFTNDITDKVAFQEGGF